MPLWLGIHTKAWMRIIFKGGIKPQNMMKFIRQFRTILRDHTTILWKLRCEKVYSTEQEVSRHDSRHQRAQAAKFIKQIGLQFELTVEKVLQMTPLEKRILHDNTTIIRPSHTQTKLEAHHLWIRIENTNTPLRTTRKRTQHMINQDLKDRQLF